jgi:DNA-directed RNA polymerase specialized sigma24 family protein
LGGGLEALHQRLIERDPAALDEIAARALPEIIRALRRRGGDSDARVEAAEDAILEYARRPASFDASRLVPLGAYLLMIARQNLIDRLRREARRRERQARIIQQLALEGRRPTKGTTGDADDGARITALASDPGERAALRLWLGGAPSNAIAAALGLDGATAIQAARAVKQLRDRIVKRGRRRSANPNGMAEVECWNLPSNHRPLRQP